MSVEVWQDQGIALHGLGLFGGSMIRCITEHYTCGSLIVRAVTVVGAMPLPKTWLGLPVLGEASKFTNLWSLVGFQFPHVRIPRPILGTRNVYRIIGRVHLFLAVGLLVYDVLSIGLCAE